MPRTMTLYSYSELTEEVKKRALKQWMDSERWGSWNDDVIREDIENDSIEKLLEAGYTVATEKREYPYKKGEFYDDPIMYWSASHCQDDDFNWKSTIDLVKIAERLLSKDDFMLVEPMLPHISASTEIRNHGGNSHSTALLWEDNTESVEGFEAVVEHLRIAARDRLEAAIRADFRMQRNELLKNAFEVIDGHQSEDSAVDCLEASEQIEFDEDGDLQ